MRNAWRLAAKNLARNRRRNVATGAAITLGFCGLVLIGGYAVRVERFLRTNTVYLQQTGHLAVYKEGGLERGIAQPAKYAFSPAEQASVTAVLARHNGVELFGRHLTGMGLAGNGCKTVPFSALGVEPAVQARVFTHPEVVAASPELARPLKGGLLAEYPGTAGAAALSAGLAELLGKPRVHDELGPAAGAPFVPDCAAPDARARIASDANVQLAGLTWAGAMSAVDAEVVSLFHTPLAETEDGAVITSLETLQALFDTDAVSFFSVYLKDADETQRLATELEAALRAAGTPARVYAFSDERVGPMYAGTLPFLRSLVGFIGLLVAMVVVLSILNAMTLAVLERSRELGMFRALGFTRGQVLGLWVREALLLAAGSVAVGLVLALAVAAAVNGANLRFSPPGVPGTIQFLVTPTPALCAWLAAALLPLAAAATWLAARRKVRASVVGLLQSHSS